MGGGVIEVEVLLYHSPSGPATSSRLRAHPTAYASGLRPDDKPDRYAGKNSNNMQVEIVNLSWVPVMDGSQEG